MEFGICSLGFVAVVSLPHMKIIPLSEGTFTIDKTKIFVPFNQQHDDLQQRPIGSLLVEVQPFAIITSKDVLLIDAGLGFSVNGELQIHYNLKANGIQPEQITKVLLSHLHKDHAGGVSMKDRLGNYSLAFPNATYYAQKKEYEFAIDTGFPSFMTEEIGVLENSPNVIWLDGDGKIDNYISYQITSAHSPFHQVFWIEEDEEILFFGGDDAPQLQQMKSKFVAKYDYDGKKCMQLRQQWWEEGKNKGWRFMFYHDIKTPTYHHSS
jgi:glyoxylase-like metal-dependent hydrolase (beta-lactamase superfamily II)